MGLSAKTEGGPLDAHGNMILGRSTMEDYAEGRGNYVTVAMDIASDWQGKYLISAAYPGVVFKVMDNGDHGNHKTGRDWVTSHGKIQRWRATSYARCAIRGRQGAINNAEERSEPSGEITRAKSSRFSANMRAVNRTNILMRLDSKREPF